MVRKNVRLKNSLGKAFGKKQNTLQTFPAIMGDGHGNVETDREGYVYVRVGNQVRIVYNDVVAPQNNLPVTVGITTDFPQQLKIISVRTFSNSEYEGKVVTQPLGKHAESHIWGSVEQNGGTDVVFVELRQFMPLRLTPFGEMNVGILHGIVPGYSGSWFWNDNSLIDLEGLQPTTSGSWRWVLFSMGYGGDLIITSGSVYSGPTDLAGIPGTPEDSAIDVGAIRLYAGQYQITDTKESTDILDMRYPYRHHHYDFLTDAPSDGTTYGRKDGSWEAISSSGIFVTGTHSIDLSLDGSTLSADAIVDDSTIEIDASNGLQVKDGGIGYVKLESGIVKEILTSNRTYYVSTTGSDTTGDGSSGNAWLTIQHAIDYCSAMLDLDKYALTIDVGDGTYAENVVARTMSGSGTVTILGDTSNPSNVIINAPLNCFVASYCYTPYYLKGFEFRSSGSNRVAVSASNATSLIQVEDCYFNSPNFIYGVLVQNFSNVKLVRPKLTGALTAFLRVQNARIQCDSTVLTLTGTVSFSSAGVLCTEMGNVLMTSFTFTGSATGKRYSLSQLSLIRTGSGGSSTYLPGDVAGTVNDNSVYD